MSLPPHREKDAKVEGRDPPETPMGAMAPFKSLLGKLLKVPMSEVREQQKSYGLYRQVTASNKKLSSSGNSAKKISKTPLPSTADNKPNAKSKI